MLKPCNDAAMLDTSQPVTVDMTVTFFSHSDVLAQVGSRENSSHHPLCTAHFNTCESTSTLALCLTFSCSFSLTISLTLLLSYSLSLSIPHSLHKEGDPPHADKEKASIWLFRKGFTTLYIPNIIPENRPQPHRFVPQKLHVSPGIFEATHHSVHHGQQAMRTSGPVPPLSHHHFMLRFRH